MLEVVLQNLRGEGRVHDGVSGSMVRTTSPRHTTSAADRPAISAGKHQIDFELRRWQRISSSARNSIPERLMFSVVPARQPLFSDRPVLQRQVKIETVARKGDELRVRSPASTCMAKRADM